MPFLYLQDLEWFLSWVFSGLWRILRQNGNFEASCLPFELSFARLALLLEDAADAGWERMDAAEEDGGGLRA